MTLNWNKEHSVYLYSPVGSKPSGCLANNGGIPWYNYTLFPTSRYGATHIFHKNEIGVEMDISDLSLIMKMWCEPGLSS